MQDSTPEQAAPIFAALAAVAIFGGVAYGFYLIGYWREFLTFMLAWWLIHRDMVKRIGQ